MKACIARLLLPSLVMGTVASCAPAAISSPGPGADEVRNIILLISDGAGIGAWSAAGFAQDDLRVEEMSVTGLVKTRSASHKVTDSAASATAYATGQRATNRSLSVGPSAACPLASGADSIAGPWPAGCAAIESWFAVAKAKGRGTGITTTAAVVDATPAAFVAHSPSRYWYDDLAEQVTAFGLDVMIGGGLRHFSAEGRRDGQDVIGESCKSANCLFWANDLAAYRADDRPLIGLFSDVDMDDLDGPRPVRVPEMVAAALARLSREEQGFVSVFETEATDNDGHGNVPDERITADILEFDEAVGVALDFARRTPGTLVIATSDHETGGLSLIASERDYEFSYSTSGHSGAMVPIFAYGPGSERFSGIQENYEVGQKLMEIVAGW